MLRLTLAQMRRSLPRVVAAGIAIVISTAFVAATLLVTGILNTTARNAIGASYAESDVVVDSDQAAITRADLEKIRATAGVEAVQPRTQVWLDLSAGGKNDFALANPAGGDARLSPYTFEKGRAPSKSGEIAMTAEALSRLQVGIGDAVTVEYDVYKEDAASPEGYTSSTEHEKLTVVGVVTDPAGGFSGLAPCLATEGDLTRWAEARNGGAAVDYSRVLVLAATGTDAQALAQALKAELPGTNTRTTDRAIDEEVASFLGDAAVLTGFILAFAAVALLVAGLVISNTFQVLIAQRTRNLALLRCVGATRSQLRRSVLAEASILAVASSVIGVALGCLLAQSALWIVGPRVSVPLPQVIEPTVWVVAAPLVVGVAVTLLAAMLPARLATRVAPLEALRPAEAPSLRAKVNRPRLVLSSLATVAGFALIAGGIAVSLRGDEMGWSLGLLMGILGGMVSVIGILVGTVFWVPWVVSLLGRPIARTGPGARIAAANTLRNPRRTASTTTALLVGVTLVALMATGAVSAQRTLDGQLAENFPVDVQVGMDDGGLYESSSTSMDTTPTEVSAAMVSAVEAVDGIEATTQVRATRAGVEGAKGAFTVGLEGVDPTAASAVVLDPNAMKGLDDHAVVMAADDVKEIGATVGEQITVTVEGRTFTGTLLTGNIARPGIAVVTAATLTALDPEAPLALLWARIAEGAGVSSVVADVQQVVGDVASGGDGSAVPVTGAAIQRAAFESVVSTLLAIVIGLLGVAVLIALIGVANTLSLSVIERRRESALLRAMGLTRGQLRWMLALEGMLIAGVGALLGCIIGTAYGWAGAYLLLSLTGGVDLAVPWEAIGTVLVIAVVAGMLASVLPGRSAARTPPAEALATE